MSQYQLLNGCYRSDIEVTPKNWNTPQAVLLTPEGENNLWVIYYRFYDPAFKGTDQWGKLIPIRNMNRCKELTRRQLLTATLIEQERELIDEQHYNPITRTYMSPENPQIDLSGNTPFIKALQLVLKKVPIKDKTRIDCTSVLKYFGASAALIKKDKLPLKEVKGHHIISILEHIKHIPVTYKKGQRTFSRPKVWNDNQYNHYCKYLSILYGYLEKPLEIVEYNVMDKISRKEILEDPDKRRDTLTDAQRRRIDSHLMERCPEFRRFVHIFFHSGARIEEILSVKGHDVDLDRQRFKLLVEKGAKKKYVYKPIKNLAFPFWKEILKDCYPGDYVFSVGLVPAERTKPIRAEQITRRWERYVKKELGIRIDFYSLKHLNTTEERDILERTETSKAALQLVAEHNSHTTGKMVAMHYDTKNEQRAHNKIKAIGNSFA